MSIIDIVIFLTVVASLLIGLYRGFISEIFSLLSWLAALWLAWVFTGFGAELLIPYMDQPAFRAVLSFAAVFVASLVLLSMLSHFIQKFLSFAALVGVDRYLGMFFGIARGVIIVALLIMVGTFMDFASQPWWKTSLLVGHFDPVVDFIRELLPEHLAELV